jgi:hypothetical protein
MSTPCCGPGSRTGCRSRPERSSSRDRTCLLTPDRTQVAATRECVAGGALECDGCACVARRGVLAKRFRGALCRAACGRADTGDGRRADRHHPPRSAGPSVRNQFAACPGASRCQRCAMRFGGGRPYAPPDKRYTARAAAVQGGGHARRGCAPRPCAGAGAARSRGAEGRRRPTSGCAAGRAINIQPTSRTAEGSCTRSAARPRGRPPRRERRRPLRSRQGPASAPPRLETPGRSRGREQRGAKRIGLERVGFAPTQRRVRAYA